jgi:ribonuclease HI
LKKKLNPEHVILIETDGACSGNADHKGPGGWGAIIWQCGQYTKMFRPNADTANNETELKAMLMALMETPLYSYIVIESDSQLRIDTLTTYARRWRRNGWRKPYSHSAANVHLIEPLMKMIEKRWVTFKNVKGHNVDECNDRVDRLAVQERDKQAKEVCVQIAMTIKVGRDLRFFGIERFHLNSLDNLKDICPEF